MPKQAQPPARLEGSRWTPYLFVAPVAVYLLVFQGYPLLQELILGFTSTSLLSPADHTFVGLRNYVELIGTSDFRGALLITAVYTIACVVLSIGLGLLAALLLNGPFLGRGVARAMVTIPWAAPPVARLLQVRGYNIKTATACSSRARFPRSTPTTLPSGTKWPPSSPMVCTGCTSLARKFFTISPCTTRNI